MQRLARWRLDRLSGAPPKRKLKGHISPNVEVPLMSVGPEVAVVIVNYRTPELVLRSVATLQRERALLPSLTAIVVDGGSGDGSAETLGNALDEQHYSSWVSFLPLSINGGFGWANNQAMLTLARRETPPDFIHLLNPDTEVVEGSVTRLVQELQAHPECGAAGSQLLAPDGRPVPSAFRFPSLGREFVGAAQSEVIGRALGVAGVVVSAQESIDVDWVTGASVMVRAKALQETGLFDDGFFLYFEEVELMHRLKARGWTVRHVPASRIVHIEGAATGVGAAAADRPLPPYWYQSRRRYFELTGGVAVLLGANLASLAGLAIAGAKKLAGRPPASKSYRAGDLLRLGFWPSGSGIPSSAPRLGDAPGQPPAWMMRA
jgi:N-acetylglucosaminyl-diphospho-decaprenol L-rhamnosyltransferase